MDTSALTSSAEVDTRPQAATTPLIPQLFRWGRIVGEFAAVQVWVQLAGAIAGFIVVRSLNKPEYALYAVANAGLSLFNILSDTGISSTMRTIGGEIHADRSQLSQLVATTIDLRKLFAIAAVLISLPVTVWMLVANGATGMQTVALCVVMLAACWPILTSTVLRETALLLGRYRKVQIAEFSASAFRLVCLAASFAWLSSLLAMAFIGVTNWLQWLIYRRSAADDVETVAPRNAIYRKRMLGITRRMLPNVLFFCFQGQVTFLLLTVVGTTTGLADVAALGRIAILLTIFGSVFNNVLAPRFARCQNPTQLPRLYLGLLGLTFVCLAPVVIFAWLFPAPLLMILGNAYRELEYECFLIVLSGCLTQFLGALASLNYSRSWIRFYTYFHIPVVLSAQIAAILLFDVSTVRGILLFTIISTAVPIPVLAADGWFGLKRFARQGPIGNRPEFFQPVE